MLTCGRAHRGVWGVCFFRVCWYCKDCGDASCKFGHLPQHAIGGRHRTDGVFYVRGNGTLCCARLHLESCAVHSRHDAARVLCEGCTALMRSYCRRGTAAQVLCGGLGVGDKRGRRHRAGTIVASVHEWSGWKVEEDQGDKQPEPRTYMKSGCLGTGNFSNRCSAVQKGGEAWVRNPFPIKNCASPSLAYVPCSMSMPFLLSASLQVIDVEVHGGDWRALRVRLERGGSDEGLLWIEDLLQLMKRDQQRGMDVLSALQQWIQRRRASGTWGQYPRGWLRMGDLGPSGDKGEWGWDTEAMEGETQQTRAAGPAVGTAKPASPSSHKSSDSEQEPQDHKRKQHFESESDDCAELLGKRARVGSKEGNKIVKGPTTKAQSVGGQRKRELLYWVPFPEGVFQAKGGVGGKAKKGSRWVDIDGELYEVEMKICFTRKEAAEKYLMEAKAEAELEAAAAAGSPRHATGTPSVLQHEQSRKDSSNVRRNTPASKRRAHAAPAGTTESSSHFADSGQQSDA